MGVLKKICVISEEYPTDKSPKYPFVDQLVCQMADLGIECTVLNPVSLTRKILYKEELKPKIWHKTTQNGNAVEIVCPRYFSYSTRKLGLINTAQWTFDSFKNTCLKWLKDNHDFDAVYGHFIYPSGMTANLITELYGISSFLAYGENTSYTIDFLGVEETRKHLRNISGVISVSTDNKRVLLNYGFFPEDKVEVFPNGINNKKFFPRDKSVMRGKYNLPADDFIVAFVGDFIDIKGSERLSRALELVGTDKVKSIFLGAGDRKPECQGILLQGLQPHDTVPELLSAADVFVLPTLAEGCCNAIIEAMACGLPVVSSDGPFNDDILDESCSIRIDPADIDAITEAIKRLFLDAELRQKLSEGALRKASQLNLETRAKNIAAFIESKL